MPSNILVRTAMLRDSARRFIASIATGDNLALLHPGMDFNRPPNLCPHRKPIELPNIRIAIEELRRKVMINPAVATLARPAIEQMVAP